MTQEEFNVLSSALHTLKLIKFDFHIYKNNNQNEPLNFHSLGKIVYAKRVLNEALGLKIDQLHEVLLPGETNFDDEDDDINDWYQFTSPFTINNESLSLKEKKIIYKLVYLNIQNMCGISDSDDACLRCCKREIAEVLGLPLKNNFLLFEKEVSPKYFKNYKLCEELYNV